MTKPIKQGRLVCACGCKTRFDPVNPRHIYATLKCKNRATQRAWRMRAVKALATVNGGK